MRLRWVDKRVFAGQNKNGNVSGGGDLGSTGRKVASVAGRVAPVNSQPKISAAPVALAA